MATETQFVTAPSTPEPADAMAPTPVAESPPAALHDSLEIVVEQRLRQHAGDGGSSSLMTIFRFRVPAHVRHASKQLYKPRLVSIGPYYRGRAALRAMEQHKLLAEFPVASLAKCVRAVRDVEQQARRCYSEQTDIFDAGAGAVGENWQPRQQGDTSPGDEFAEMLLLDGCFVLQFFIKWYRGEPDRLCDVGWGLPLLLSDLLLRPWSSPTMGGLRGGARLLSSYAALVGALVRTGTDVEHLQKRGVGENLLSGDGDAATGFFQQLGSCSSLDYGDEHHFAAMFRDLRGYYHSSCHRHRAKFLHDHCSNPWAVLALVVAVCAFCFALIKLGATIYGLAHPYCHC